MLIKPLILDTRHISSFFFQWKRIENVWFFYLSLRVKLIEQLATQIVFQMKDQEWQSFIHFMSGTDEREPGQRSFSNAFHSYKKKEQFLFKQKCRMIAWTPKLSHLFHSCLISLAVVQKGAMRFNTQQTCANLSITYFNWQHVFTYSAFNGCPEVGSLILTHPFMLPTY